MSLYWLQMFVKLALAQRLTSRSWWQRRAAELRSSWRTLADRSALPAFLLALNPSAAADSNLNWLAVFVSLWSGNQLLGIAVEREKEELEEGDGWSEWVSERKEGWVYGGGEDPSHRCKQCEGRGLTVHCRLLIIHSPCFTGKGYKLQNLKLFS